MIKQVFVVFSIFLVLALSVVPCFASDASYSNEDWYVKPAVPYDISFHVTFQDSYVNQFDVHTISFPSLPQIPLTGIVETSPFIDYAGLKFDIENGSGTCAFRLRTDLSSIISNYDVFYSSGTLSFTHSSTLRYTLNRPSVSNLYPIALDFCEISAPDFYAFSNSSYGVIESEQYSQMSLKFGEGFIDSYCDVFHCSVFFTYAPITISGLGEFQTVDTSFLNFAYQNELGEYIVDPGRFIHDYLSEGSEGDVQFYLIRDFSLVLVPSEGYIYADPNNYNYYEFTPLFTCSFVYDPRFLDPSFTYPVGGMELRDYTAWITTAVSGFFEIQIFPGFYLSGFLMVVIAFACAIWFLKIFAGG